MGDAGGEADVKINAQACVKLTGLPDVSFAKASIPK